MLLIHPVVEANFISQESVEGIGPLAFAFSSFSLDGTCPPATAFLHMLLIKRLGYFQSRLSTCWIPSHMKVN